MTFLLLGSRFSPTESSSFSRSDILLRNCGRAIVLPTESSKPDFASVSASFMSRAASVNSLHGRSRTVFGCISHCHDSASQRGRGGHTQHDQPGHSTECCGNVRALNDFGDCGVCRQCISCTAILPVNVAAPP